MEKSVPSPQEVAVPDGSHGLGHAAAYVRPATHASVDGGEMERQGRITYAPDIDERKGFGHRSSLGRSRSRDSISIRSVRRTIDPSVILPPQFRTLSFGIEETKRQTQAKKKPAAIEFGDMDYHTLSIDEIFTRLQTTRATGLTSTQAAQTLKAIGPNMPSPPPSRWFRNTIGYLFGGFGAILFAAAILVFVAWKPLGQPPALANLALAIVLVIVWIIQAAFSFWQDFSTSRVMASIGTMLPAECFVLRDGSLQRVHGKDVVPGDILRITLGNKLPADVRFVEVSSDARFDRSILTGEAMPLLGSVDSTDSNYLETACIGMAGTHCVSGSAWGVIVETGDRTVFGRIAKLTSTPSKGLTPLQREIYYFVAIIVVLMLVMILVVIAVWAGWLRKAHPDWISVPVLIVDCVSVAVAFIPEGLPIAVTASLTITANIMMRNKVLCKSLKTVETLGAVNVICSDKTGTLTRNIMAVTEYLVGKESTAALKAPGIYDTQTGLQKLATVAAVCNEAEFDASSMNLPIADRKVIGDATDSAILRFAESMAPVAEARSAVRSTFKVAFNSKNKFAINVVQAETDTSPLMMIKGAPDVILPRCGSYIDGNGFVERLEETDRQTVERTKDYWSSQGRRVILFAQRPLEQLQFQPTEQPREYEREIMGLALSELVLVGLVAIVDPPRAEIPEVVRTLRGAGIRVFMVTGDYKLTAAAIAAECGIITHAPKDIDDVTNLAFDDGYLKAAGIEEKRSTDSTLTRSIVLSGADIETLDKSQWNMLCNYDEVVFARTTPEHKLRIVKELQARDLVVGMTGDGVNDAPSLKAADIGIAMGGGSDVALEAADMVLLDSFAGIVEGVRYGRVAYDNLRKTICYLLPAGSFSEFWPVITNVIFGLPQVLSSFLMIIICCLTDCAAAIAIAYEKPEADVLMRPPRNAKHDHLVDWRLILQAYGSIGVIETVCSFAMSYWYAQRAGLTFSALWFGFGNTPNGMTAEAMTSILNTASSIYFVNLVVMQWFNLFAVRTRRLSVLNHRFNWYLVPAIVFALSIAILFLYVPKLHDVLGTATVPVAYWFLPMGFGLGLLLLDEGRKCIDESTESTEVIICGGGPTGAMLSALLGQYGVPNVVLEREPEITTDPRGIALDEDGIRCIQAVGMYDRMYSQIALCHKMLFISGSDNNLHKTPFNTADLTTSEGNTSHVGFVFHKQPELEKALRDAIATHSASQLQSRCTVQSICEDSERVTVEYTDARGATRKLSGAFLVGADGKTGYVRKRYLEAKGVRLDRCEGTNYEESWVALNWHITPPTPVTHPDFPLWKLGYTPEGVYDAFFPPDFRFLCNPARPSVCGRFGRPEDRLWRFEFVVDSTEDATHMASDEETRKIVFPYITHPGRKYGLSRDIMFPADCIETLRSRPFSFLARCCNYWAVDRVIVVGDAAHVFPPFGGQGITSGFRDATGLAWRLCHMYRRPKTDHQSLLRGWYLERKQQLEHSLAATIRNGEFVTNGNFFKAFLRDWVLWAMQQVPWWRRRMNRVGRATTKYHHLPGLPFLPEYGGGVNLPQVYARPLDGPTDTVAFTDDLIFARHKKGLFQLLVMVDEASQVDAVVKVAEGTPGLFGDFIRQGEATLLVNDLAASRSDIRDRIGWTIARIASGDEFAREEKLCRNRPAPAFYNAWRIREELKAGAKFIIVRADKFVYAACSNRVELEAALRSLPQCLHT
ncbi:hypothetical protein LTR36_006381 [Oleoguttula mirabilis]|uniref:Cation-transporting P-type ATPase N-terminal domain-containing protein n=1 Tax=Oleoguttula mirabilis TaxID=1507867 RepID=A0AAV9JUX2_9PEZI|nr:hypothetical protein LTR36_006381 [Oleoguttula mirabilis]